MVWSKRVAVHLLLVSVWTVSLFLLAYPARAQAQGGGRIHIVQEGEMLREIAQQYGTDTRTLILLNDLEHPDILYVGQQLLVEGQVNEAQPSWDEEDESEQPRWDEQEQNAQPRWQDEEAQRPQQNDDYPAGAGWEPQPNQEEYHPAGVGWEPQSPQENNRAGASWEEQPSQPGYRRAGVGWEPQSSDDDLPAEDNNGGPASQASDYHPAGVGWEPQPNARPGPQVEATGEKWVDIDLSDQVLTAYQGETAIRYFDISSGSERYPTVTGSFYTYARFELDDMTGGSKEAGDYYFQADVPWVQYFYQGFAIHGAYWHNRFGSRYGHGCINMRVEESRWLYDWSATTGMRVEVHQ